MDARAAVMTGPGAGAIATVQLLGRSAKAILGHIFRGPSRELTTGSVMLGAIIDGDRQIDQVTVGCEGPETFAIHCHGNPLIVEEIVTLLGRHGVAVIRPQQMLAELFSARAPGAPIAVEARLALATVKSLHGARLLANQVQGGLVSKLRQWRAQIASIPLEDITSQAGQIRDSSQAAEPLLYGCTIALVGPPNTGKSTLLNTLAGREKAIVTDIKGTTRDWVHAEIHLPPLSVTLIDTAGLDADLAESTHVDRTAQDKSIAILQQADLVLLVLDGSQPSEPLGKSLLDSLTDRRTLVVLNKSDLPPGLDESAMGNHLGVPIHISAKKGLGLDEMIDGIHRVLGIHDVDLHDPVVFTDRQRRLMHSLSLALSKRQAETIISELLDGVISV